MKMPKKKTTAPKPKTTKKKVPYVFRTFYIDMDNTIRIQSNDKLIKLSLHLKGSEPRMIGTITKSTRTIEMRRKMAIHLFRKGNAYGFNEYILRESKTFDWIRLRDDAGNDWKIPKKFILENGQYLNFKEQGYELQLFVPLEMLEPYRVTHAENRRF
jgi:hypothetical protein